MSKKSKQKRKSSDRVRRNPAPQIAEDRRSLAFTVAWMMSTLATMGALVLYAISLWMSSEPAGPNEFNPGELISGMALFTGVVTGTLTIAAIPVVYRVRAIDPPLPVTVASVLVAIAPWLIMLVNLWNR